MNTVENPLKTRIMTINRGILWAKVWGIAAMQGAITLTWVIYNLYLPLLLVELGLAEKLAATLSIVENALEASIEPIFGALSDRQQQVFGSRVPIISMGVVLSSALFIAIPVSIIFGNDNKFSQWLFILSVVAWASVMAIFRSPAMALLGRSANTELLPQAASILTLVAGIVGAFQFDVYGSILKLGAGFAFAIGSFALLGAAALLRIVHPPEPEISADYKLAKISRLRLGLIFLTGISVSWGLRFSIPTVSQVLTTEFGTANTKLAMTLFFVFLGLGALPAGKIASQVGNSTAMTIGGWGTIVFLLALLLLPNGLIKLAAIAGIVFLLSLILNGAVPFALNSVPKSRGGLGVGMYFGGFTGGMSLFNFLGNQFLGDFSFRNGAIGGSVAFLSAVLLIFLLTKNSSSIINKDFHLD
jgi:MFS family permease